MKWRLLVATEQLLGKARGKFYEVTFAIPAELTRGRSKITAKLQAHPRKTAAAYSGRVY